MSAGPPPGRLGRLADHPAALPALLGLALILRLWALGGVGYPSDPGEITRWAEGIRQFGLSGFTANVQGGYYPLILYLLVPVAALFSGRDLYTAVKGVVIPFDLLIVLVLYLLVRRTAGRRYALLAAALYALNPASIIGGAYWGQVDAIGALGMLLTLLALGSGRPGLAGVLTLVSGLFKAIFGVVGLVVAAATLVEAARRRAWRPAALAIAGGILGWAIVALPIRMGPLDYLALVREGGVRFPFTSLYALNIWFVFVGFFKPDDAYVALGIALLLVGLAAALAPLWRDRSTAMLLAVAGAVVLAFYFLPTKVHERYLFPAIVLFAPLAAVRPRLRVPYVVLSLCFTIGLAYTLWQGSQSRFAVPGFVEGTLFTIYGIGVVAFVLMGSAALLCWRLFHGEASLTVPRGISTPPARTADRDGGPRFVVTSEPDGALRIVLPFRRLAVPRLPAVPAALLRRLRALDRGRVAAWSLIGLVMAFTAVGVSSELLRIPALNDGLFHMRLVARADEALGGAANPIDFWLPELEQGFPVFYYYQQLPHLAVALLHRLVFGLVDLRTLFDLVRWGLMTALPLTAYASLRWAGFPRTVAAVAGAGSALVSSNLAFGLEYDNYLWRGYGLYTQLWGAHLAFVAFAATWRLFQRRGGVAPAVVALAALALTHLVYGYMAALSAGVLMLAGLGRASARHRLVAFALLGLLTAVVSLYMLLPFATDQQYLSVSPYFPRFRFDGFGLRPVLEALARGDILDSHRFPVLTVLAAVGALGAVLRRDRAALTILALFAVWVVLLGGKPATDLLPLHGGLPVHRFIGSVQLFGLVLAGYGVAFAPAALAALGARLRPLGTALASLPPAAAALAVPALAVVALFPVLTERAEYYARNADWMDQTSRAIQRDRDAAAILERLRQLPPGRVHAGMRATWGDQLDFGLSLRAVKLYDALVDAGFDAVRPPAYSFSLSSDALFFFDPQRLSDYGVFGIRYVVSPPGQTLPAGLHTLLETPRYVLSELPDARLGEYVALAGRESIAGEPALVTRQGEWFGSPDEVAGRYLRLDYPDPSGRRGAGAPGCDSPAYLAEQALPGHLSFLVSCAQQATFIVKTSFHPNWRVSVDGAAVPTFMVMPDYLAVTLPPGRHAVRADYVAAGYKTPLALGGVAVLVATVVYRRRLDRLAGGEAAS